MKYIRSLIFLLAFCLTACAANRYTVTITVTNVPSYPNAITFNSDTRTATNNTSGAPQSSFLIGASIGATTTNLWNQIGLYRFSGGVTREWIATNSFRLRGAPSQSVSASLSGTWATLSFSTNSDAPGAVVRVPLSSEPTQSDATNIASLLVTGLKMSTNVLEMENGINIPYISGKTNGLVVGYGIIQPDGFGNAGIFSTIGGPYEAAEDSDILNLYSAKLNFPILKDVVTNTWFATNFFGYFTAPGASIDDLHSTHGTQSGQSILASTLDGTNSVTGAWSFTRTNVTSLANGNNSGLDFGGKTYVKIKAGSLSATFAICGILGGSDGRVIYAQNVSGQTMTVPNESGAEATPANRIKTTGAATISIPDGGTAIFLYDTEDSRWRLASPLS